MDEKTNKIIDVYFFGAGKKGRYWLECCRALGIRPKGILDNNKALCGSLCQDVTIYHPDILNQLSFEFLFITCNREDEIVKQLLDLGVPKNKIVVHSHYLLNYFLYHSVLDPAVFMKKEKLKNFSSDKKVLIDLRNGMVLGGVESWAYGLAKDLKEKGYQGLYLASDEMEPSVKDETFPARMLRYKELPEERDRIRLCVKEILENGPCTVVCNFAHNIFWSACIARRLSPDSVRVVAVQHCDEGIYYETYGLWKKYIDRYLVISSRMESKVLFYGTEQSKIRHLGWKVACEERLKRLWSADGTCLQIGYAGRVTIKAKRSDLLPVLAVKLRDRGICFRINIAGSGNYSEALCQRIGQEGLEEYIRLLGYVSRSDIPKFWESQDVMISCSEFEGHSISQAEAMAAGAVPVLTNVSGAEDDVTDGYNGYIVDIRDMEAMADRICRLYHDRNMLAWMGRNAHDTIYQRQANMDQGQFWEGLLKEIWQ